MEVQESQQTQENDESVSAEDEARLLTSEPVLYNREGVYKVILSKEDGIGAFDEKDLEVY